MYVYPLLDVTDNVRHPNFQRLANEGKVVEADVALIVEGANEGPLGDARTGGESLDGQASVSGSLGPQLNGDGGVAAAGRPPRVHARKGTAMRSHEVFTPILRVPMTQWAQAVLESVGSRRAGGHRHQPRGE